MGLVNWGKELVPGMHSVNLQQGVCQINRSMDQVSWNHLEASRGNWLGDWALTAEQYSSSPAGTVVPEHCIT